MRRKWIWLSFVLGSCFWLAGCAAAPALDFAPEAPAAAPSEMGGGDQFAGEQPPEGVARMVVARASVNLVVADTAQAVEAVGQLVDEVGGYVANTNLYRSGSEDTEQLWGTLTLRVPAAQVDDVIARLESLAVRVDSKNVTREDVTDQYTDIQAQLTNLQATEEELRALLAEVRAKPNATAEDIMAVHRRLSEVRGEIEQLQGRKNMLDNLIALATIEVNLEPDGSNRPLVEEGWRPVPVVRDALRALVNTFQLLGNVAIWLVVFFGPLVLLVLIPTVLLLRRWTRQRRAKRMAAEAGSS